jgi:hypothetical protein
VIAAGFASGSIRLFQPDDAEILADIRQRSTAIGDLCFGNDGNELFSFSEDGHLVAYRTDSVRERLSCSSPSAALASVAVFKVLSTHFPSSYFF